MSLRERALKGGTYLVLRQGLSMAISLVGVLTITRLIGPYDYGVYTAVWNLTSVIAQIGKVGLDVYLVRGQENPSEHVYHQAFSFLLVFGILVAAGGILLAPLIVQWLNHEDYLDPLRAALLIVPVIMLATPAVAQLDRDLNYRKIAMIEIIGQLLFYAAAIPLALLKYGPWSQIVGLVLWQTWALGANYVAVRYRPRWHWSMPELRDMLKYGLGYSVANWIWRLRPLVNTLIVGRFLGPEGVGIVALALRLVDVLSFVRASLWRLALSVLAKVQDDIPRLRRALEESMGIQVLSLGPLVAGLALVAPWLLPRLFGAEWAAAPQIYPFVALSALMHGIFNMHISVLYVLKRNNDVSLFYIVHISILAVMAFIFVPFFASMNSNPLVYGLIGYGIAEVGVLISYLILHRKVSNVFPINYTLTFLWVLAFVPPLFFSFVPAPFGFLLWVPAIIVACNRSARSQIGEYLTYARTSLSKRRNSSHPGGAGGEVAS